jgi:lipopolysaccharide export LptBFGC system permease protein LptF
MGLARAGLDELSARPEALGTAGLMRRVERLRASGRGRPAEELLLQARFAFPCLNLLVVLIAWRLALRGRDRPLLLDLLQALLWLLGLWLLLAVGWLLARVGWISPALGAWLPLLAGLLLAGLLPKGASAASRISAPGTPGTAELGRRRISR